MLDIISDINLVVRKDYQVSSTNFTTPGNANCFEQGLAEQIRPASQERRPVNNEQLPH